MKGNVANRTEKGDVVAKKRKNIVMLDGGRRRRQGDAVSSVNGAER